MKVEGWQISIRHLQFYRLLGWRVKGWEIICIIFKVKLLNYLKEINFYPTIDLITKMCKYSIWCLIYITVLFSNIIEWHIAKINIHLTRLGWLCSLIENLLMNCLLQNTIDLTWLSVVMGISKMCTLNETLTMLTCFEMDIKKIFYWIENSFHTTISMEKLSN